MVALAVSLLYLDQKPNPLFKPAELGLAIQTALEQDRQYSKFPGVNVTVILPDGRIVNVAVGESDVRTHRKLQPSDRMLAGSIGKTFFAALAQQFCAEKKINLDDKVAKWLSGNSWYDALPNASLMTIRQLMNHTAGLPEYYAKPATIAAFKANPQGTKKPEELLAYIAGDPAESSAGSRFSYADTHYIVLGLMLEKAGNISLLDEISKRFLKPLKLNGIMPSNQLTIPKLVAGNSRPNPPFWFAGPTIEDGKCVLNPQFEGCGGGFASTSESLAKWAKELYGKSVLTPYQLAQMQTGVPADTGPGEQYGLGVQIRPSKDGVSFGHSGWFPGYLSDMAYFPKLKIAVAVQFNTDDMRQTRGMPYKWVCDIAGIAEHQWIHGPLLPGG